MKWFTHKTLSDQDMEWLAGTPLMEQLVSNRLILMYGPNDNQPTFEELGCYDIEEPFYMKRRNDETLEFYFASVRDLDAMKERFTVAKMAL